MNDLLRAGALISHQPGRVLLARGPFARVSRAPDGRPALFAPDFFLADDAPWFLPATFEDLSLEEARAALPAAAGPPPEIQWKVPSRADFVTAFCDLQSRIRAGEVVKAVPVAFATARLENPPGVLLPRLLQSALKAPPGCIPYGLWEEGSGLVGATPELLLETSADGGVRTVALAGTARLADAGQQLAAPKERAEHQIVIDEVVRTFSELGTVECGPTEVVTLPHLAHLKTEITLRTRVPAAFPDLVRTLHPTPALGGSPRRESFAWLKAQDRGVNRGRFGAPFGYADGDGVGRCVVAIRCIQWAGDRLRLGAGAGVMAGSRLEREWEELEHKREAVTRMLLS